MRTHRFFLVSVIPFFPLSFFFCLLFFPFVFIFFPFYIHSFNFFSFYLFHYCFFLSFSSFSPLFFQWKVSVFISFFFLPSFPVKRQWFISNCVCFSLFPSLTFFLTSFSLFHPIFFSRPIPDQRNESGL